MIVFVIKVHKVLIKEPKSKEQSRQTVAIIRQNVIRNCDIWKLNERMWFNDVVSVYTGFLEIPRNFLIRFLLADQFVSSAVSNRCE